ncbi:MAG: fumarylacetoacetate hydrolase family protein [Candidatus Acidiferrales bacterium]
MKICRFRLKEPIERSEPSSESEKSRSALCYGVAKEGQIFEVSDPFQSKTIRSQEIQLQETQGRSWPLADVQLLAPSVPSKIVCVGRNYAEHAAELGNALPKEPLIFLKPPSAVIAPEEAIVLTPHSERVDYEGELAIVIRKICGHLNPSDDVQPYILGYTCLNDVTARDLQEKDVQFTRAKGFDTFCPFGPWIETDLDLSAARVETFVNKKQRQSAAIAEMIFAVDVVIRWISQMMTLVPGDVIATGTPSGVGPLAVGDVVEVSISGIGTLRNPVVGPR